jgi:hypothetical protein
MSDQIRELWIGRSEAASGSSPAATTPDSASLKEKEGEEMLTMVIERTRSFDRRIAVRNAIECAAAILVVGVYGWAAWNAPSALEKAGNAIVAASAIWIAYYILRFGSGPRALDPGVNLNAYNQLLKEGYEQQIRLLRNVKYWYLLPPYVGVLVASVGLWLRLHGQGQSPRGAVVSVAAVTVVFVLVWILNEVYGVRYLERLKRELASIEGCES